MSQLWILIRKIEVLGALFGSGDKEIVTKKNAWVTFSHRLRRPCAYIKRNYTVYGIQKIILLLVIIFQNLQNKCTKI